MTFNTPPKLLTLCLITALGGCGLTEQERQEAEANKLYTQAQYQLEDLDRLAVSASEGERIFRQAQDAYDALMAEYPDTQVATWLADGTISFHTGIYHRKLDYTEVDEYSRENLSDALNYYRGYGLIENDIRFYNFLFDLTQYYGPYRNSSEALCGLVVDVYSSGDYELASVIVKGNEREISLSSFAGACARGSLSHVPLANYHGYASSTSEHWLEATGDLLHLVDCVVHKEALDLLYDEVERTGSITADDPAYSHIGSPDHVLRTAAYRLIVTGRLTDAFALAAQVSVNDGRGAIVEDLLFASTRHQRQADDLLEALHTLLEAEGSADWLWLSPLQFYPNSEAAREVELLRLEAKQNQPVRDETWHLYQLAESYRLLDDSENYHATLDELDALVGEGNSNRFYRWGSEFSYYLLYASVGSPERFEAIVESLGEGGSYHNDYLSVAYVMLAAEYNRKGKTRQTRAAMDLAIGYMAQREGFERVWPNEVSYLILNHLPDITDEQREQVVKIMHDRLHEERFGSRNFDQLLHRTGQAMPN
uniref:hypothetical protein n=1 Tax=Thaumasiovibrio occultus TaxID=1891184 RepID=UPI000B34E455|nr:hypothetical protein [Thaumasiovibrio occultus]